MLMSQSSCMSFQFFRLRHLPALALEPRFHTIRGCQLPLDFKLAEASGCSDSLFSGIRNADKRTCVYPQCQNLLDSNKFTMVAICQTLPLFLHNPGQITYKSFHSNIN